MKEALIKTRINYRLQSFGKKNNLKVLIAAARVDFLVWENLSSEWRGISLTFPMPSEGGIIENQII